MLQFQVMVFLIFPFCSTELGWARSFPTFMFGAWSAEGCGYIENQIFVFLQILNHTECKISFVIFAVPRSLHSSSINPSIYKTRAATTDENTEKDTSPIMLEGWSTYISANSLPTKTLICKLSLQILLFSKEKVQFNLISSI